MKKVYAKPTITKQVIAASSPVAASCEAIALFAETVCPIKVDIGFEIEIFQDGSVCDYSAPDVNDMVCYHAPSDNNNVFTS